MSTIDRLENLTDEQKIYLLQIMGEIRKVDDFVKNYPCKDEYFHSQDPYYSIGPDFCAYSYTEDDVLDLVFDSRGIAELDYIETVLSLVEEAI